MQLDPHLLSTYVADTKLCTGDAMMTPEKQTLALPVLRETHSSSSLSKEHRITILEYCSETKGQGSGGTQGRLS